MKQLPIAFLLTLSACGGGAPGIECHGTNWYRLGLDDGAARAHGEVERYATSCGADFNRATYQQGFEAGLARAPLAPAPVAAESTALAPN